MFKILRYTKKYIIKNKLKFTIYFLFGIFSSFMNLISPKIIGNFVDYLSLGLKEEVIKYIMIFVSLNLLTFIVSYITDRLYIYIQTDAGFNLNKDLNNHMLNVSLLDSQKFESSYLTNRINNDSNSVIIFSINAILNILDNLIIFVGASIFLIKLNKILFLFVIIMCSLYVVFYYFLKEKIYKINYDLIESRSEFFSNIYKQLDNIRSIKIHSSFSQSLKKLDNAFNLLLNLTLKNQKVSYFYTSLDVILSQIMYIFLFIYGGFSVIEGNLSIGEFVMISSFLGKMLESVQFYFSFAKEIKETQASLNRIIEIENLDEEVFGNVKPKSINRINVDFSFSYTKNSKKINLKKVFSKGKIYWIKGKNGSGKSTLLDIISGLYINDFKGEIFFDTFNLKNIDLNFLRKNLISFVEQKANLIYANSINKINENTAREIVNNFGLTNIMSIEKENINFLKNLDNLSGGEKQKVQIVTEILKNSDLMLFDEPENNLDFKSGLFLENLLLKLKNNKIIILVGHNENFKNISDDIIDLN
ncbi:MAG: ABC transporter ATP-binding protein [Peptoniphilaceae bacterium]|nr:ABC transporter ATP-binding protein/permease [Peptoniphilaceae bacterium]MDD7383116.1 ABC transporter ATP-binding protein [Peptoniphilaceae bacterium]MDY3738362.1 ABC transporter ATP-binding protein [Peptoniphilaceae bacterium]